MENNGNQPNLDDWTDFAGDWIKAEFVKEFPAKIVCIGVESRFESEKAKLVAKVEYNNRTWNFDLNKTNQNFIKDDGLMPREIIGKVLVVNTTKVRNPSTGFMVDSLIIEKIVK